MQTLLLMLKLFGLVVSGAFGVLGTVYESRNKAGLLTRWGRISVAGTLAGVLVAVSAQLVENHLQEKSATKAAEQALDETRKLATIVDNLDRSLQQIDSVSVFVARLAVPRDDPSIQGPLDRVRETIRRHLAENPNLMIKDGTMTVIGMDRRGGQAIPMDVSVPISSPVFPQWATDHVANGVLAIQAMDLSFYKKPIMASQFSSVRGTKDDPDLAIDLFDRDGLALNETIKDGSFWLMGGLESDRRTWRNRTGNIVSLPDLAGAQLFVTIGPVGINIGENAKKIAENAAFLKARSEFRLGDLNLRLGTRNIWIHESDFKKFVNSEGETVWEFDFPKDYATFLERRYSSL
jgi:hypothetical protein